MGYRFIQEMFTRRFFFNFEKKSDTEDKPLRTYNRRTANLSFVLTSLFDEPSVRHCSTRNFFRFGYEPEFGQSASDERLAQSTPVLLDLELNFWKGEKVLFVIRLFEERVQTVA